MNYTTGNYKLRFVTTQGLHKDQLYLDVIQGLLWIAFDEVKGESNE